MGDILERRQLLQNIDNAKKTVYMQYKIDIKGET